jgi:hypothetical protein
MSHKFILDSCNHELQVQVTDILSKYELSKQGGPLTFKILIDLVQVNSEQAIKHLISSVKLMDAKNFDGEIIVEVVAQLGGCAFATQDGQFWVVWVGNSSYLL